MSWAELGDWWISEVETDAAYEEVVTPLLLGVLHPRAGQRYLDLGCGEGRLMRAVGATGAVVHGVELSRELAGLAAQRGPVMVGELPGLDYVRPAAYDGAYCVLVLEHLPDHAGFFRSVARVVKPEGVLGLVINHPIWTAPGSTPITDTDGEVLWRPGEYFSIGSTEEPAGAGGVTFHHRTLSDLLNAAAGAGWILERMVERPHHEYTDQRGIPRLLACRWRLGG